MLVCVILMFNSQNVQLCVPMICSRAAYTYSHLASPSLSSSVSVFPEPSHLMHAIEPSFVEAVMSQSTLPA